jgi:anti-sigma B factor antagonist
MDPVHSEPAAPVRIDGELTIYQAAELKDTLLAALAAADPLEIDLSRVTELDTAGVQLLMVLKRAARAQGRELRLLGHSPAVLEVFELLNLGGYFGDPVVMAATPRA